MAGSIQPRSGVLIVDDDVEVLQGLVGGVSGDSFSIRPALGGLQAIDAVSKQHPQLVVSSTRMKDIDGFEICRRLKAEVSTETIPVLLLSHSIDPVERVQAFRVGATDILQRPFLLEELLARINLHLDCAALRHNDRLVGYRASTGIRKIPEKQDPFESEKALRSMIQELGAFNKTLLDTTMGLIVVLDLEGRIVQFNKACAQATGWSEEEVVSKDFVQRFIPEAHRAKILAAFQHMNNNGSHIHIENEWLRRDGSRLWVAWANSVIRDETGRVKFVVATGLDRTEQRRTEREIVELNSSLEKRVEDRTTELQLANQELESFSYSVSHDLRSPLRTIDGFAKALEEDFHDALPAEAKSHLNRIRAASGHMGQLIDDLLELSRSIRSPLHRSWVNLSSMAQDILDALKRSSPDRQCKIRVQSSLASWSDPVLTRVMVQNLLENAWKYTSTNENSSISMYGKDFEGREWIVLEDNGVGFDMAYASKLFETFQRLHSHSQFPGTGVGLATVKRIVQRHGGAIFGQGVPNQGAIFRFHLGGQGFQPS